MAKTILAVSLVLFVAKETVSRPPCRQGLKRSYGDVLPQAMQTCATCHLASPQFENTVEFVESAPPHNLFGIRLSELGKQLKDAQP